MVPRLASTEVLLVGNPPGNIEDNKWDVEGRTLYLDESGGPEASTPMLRRPAWGLAWLRKKQGEEQNRAPEDMDEDECSFDGGFCGAIDDEQNTSTRAALGGLLFVLCKTAGNVVIAPDCSYVIGGFEKFRDDTQGCHADLWFCIDAARRERRGRATILKVKAHRTEKEVAAIDCPQELRHFCGNHFADRMAARVAEAARVEPEVREEILEWGKKRCWCRSELLLRTPWWLARWRRDRRKPKHQDKKNAMRCEKPSADRGIG